VAGHRQHSCRFAYLTPRSRVALPMPKSLHAEDAHQGTLRSPLTHRPGLKRTARSRMRATDAIPLWPSCSSSAHLIQLASVLSPLSPQESTQGPGTRVCSSTGFDDSFSSTTCTESCSISLSTHLCQISLWTLNTLSEHICLLFPGHRETKQKHSRLLCRPTDLRNSPQSHRAHRLVALCWSGLSVSHSLLYSVPAAYRPIKTT